MNQLIPIEIDPKTFFRKNCSLPVLPTIITQIQENMHSDDSSISMIADLVSNDPALTTQILKVVNSAYYSFPREIGDIKFAVAYLGINEVYRILLTLSVINSLAAEDKGEFEEFWMHSNYTALCTKFITNTYAPFLSPEKLWPAAILHDIGKLIYLKYFPDHYRAIIQYSKENSCMFSQAEQLLSLPSSGYIGSLLCDYWNLPDNIKMSCESHGLADLKGLNGETENGAFKRMVCLGNLIAVFTANDLRTDIKKDILDSILVALDLNESAFLAMMATIYDLKIEAESLIL